MNKLQNPVKILKILAYILVLALACWLFFTDLWNYIVVPYSHLLSDPLDFLIKNSPTVLVLSAIGAVWLWVALTKKRNPRS